MICNFCDGNGFDDCNEKCRKCYGTGFIEPLTNEEYIRTCSTEELVEELCDWFLYGTTVNVPYGLTTSVFDRTKDYIRGWLKEKHENG